MDWPAKPKLRIHLTSLLAMLMMFLCSNSLAKDIIATVDTSHIDVHTGPGRGYPVYHILERGDVVTLLKQRTAWIKIRDSKSNIGWISAKHLSELLNQHGFALNPETTDTEDFQNRRFDIGLLTGDFEGAETVAAEWSYRFAEQMAFGMRYEQSTGDISNTEIASAYLNYVPFSVWRFSPFISIGAGSLKTDPNATIAQSEARNETAMIAAVGGYFYLTQNFVVKAEYDNYTVLTEREQNEEINAWKIGLSIFF